MADHQVQYTYGDDCDSDCACSFCGIEPEVIIEPVEDGDAYRRERVGAWLDKISPEASVTTHVYSPVASTPEIESQSTRDDTNPGIYPRESSSNPSSNLYYTESQTEGEDETGGIDLRHLDMQGDEFAACFGIDLQDYPRLGLMNALEDPYYFPRSATSEYNVEGLEAQYHLYEEGIDRLLQWCMW